MAIILLQASLRGYTHAEEDVRVQILYNFYLSTAF